MISSLSNQYRAMAQGSPAFDGFIDEPDAATDAKFADSPGWGFFHYHSYCYATTDSPRGTLLIGYDPRRSYAHIAFWGRDEPNYNSGDTTDLETVLVDDLPGGGVSTPNREWGSNRYLILVNHAGKRVFNTKLNSAQVLATFNRYNRLAFMTQDGAIVQNFSLGSHSHAMSHLKTCAAVR